MSVLPAGNGVWDPALTAYLSAPDHVAAERRLEALFQEHVAPVVRKVVWARLRFGGTGAAAEAADEAYSEVATRLVGRLRRLRTEGNPPQAIGDLVGYVASAASHACDDLLRRRFPQRSRLKNRVRYLLRHTPDLSCWERPGDAPDGLLAGLALWRERDAKPASLPADFARDRLGRGAAVAGLGPADTCRAVFAAAGGPVPLDDLVDLLADLWAVRDDPAASLEAPHPDGEAGYFAPLASLIDPHGDVANAAERRALLRHLWAEIRELPPRQCAALLLNLRDGEGAGVIALLPMLDIASSAEIAAALQMPLPRLRQIWDDLPIEDAAIALLLGATRQQVINLRKVARERLGRRSLPWRGAEQGR